MDSHRKRHEEGNRRADTPSQVDGRVVQNERQAHLILGGGAALHNGQHRRSIWRITEQWAVQEGRSVGSQLDLALAAGLI